MILGMLFGQDIPYSIRLLLIQSGFIRFLRTSL
jgi:hypothetical protein